MIIIHGESKYIKPLRQAKMNTNGRLSFVRREVFADLVLSLDKIRKRLIISNVFDPFKIVTLIDLCKVKFISIKKQYKDTKNEKNSLSKTVNFPEMMFFQFEFSDSSQILLLPIFEKCTDDTRDIPDLEKRAVIWQLLLSKLKLQ